MGKAEANKLQKENALMDTAFRLFSEKGVFHTSIMEIAQKAGVAKGTFYLYFRDKYELHERLIIRKAEGLFRHAIRKSGYESLETSSDKTIALVDDLLAQLQKNPLLLRFINKNLSWGIFRRAMEKSTYDYGAVFRSIYPQVTDQEQLKLVIYTILELTGSTCYSVILENDPVPPEQYKPYLYRSIRAILAELLQSGPEPGI